MRVSYDLCKISSCPFLMSKNIYIMVFQCTEKAQNFKFAETKEEIIEIKKTDRKTDIQSTWWSFVLAMN